MHRWLVGIALALAVARPAGAQPAPGFAPEVCVRQIVVRGNTTTAERLIRRALPVTEGTCLSTDDDRLRVARYKVLALGHFREVELRFEKGSQRGEVILVVAVIERGTLVLNRIFLGTSLVTPLWAGLDAGDRNLFGLGLGASGAFVVAADGEHAGGHVQKAFTLRLDDPSITGGPLGWRAALYHIDASEPYRVRGDFSDGAAANFAAFDYRRTGGRGGLTWAMAPLARLSLDARFEAVHADLPAAPVRELPGGGTVPVDLLLRDGASRIATLTVGFDRDSRPDPVLPYAGSHLAAQLEVGVEPLSDHGQLSIVARYERWWRLTERHVVSGHLGGGLVLGDAPRFDRLHVADLARMLSPRALGLVVSTTPAFDVFGTGADEVTYGELGGVAEVQWAFRLFRSRRHVYGGDLFVGLGLWTLAERRELARSGGAALPLDILVDAGLRLDTEIGIFELSLANGLGRVPL
jgi:outer membrane protein insertion porin family